MPQGITSRWYRGYRLKIILDKGTDPEHVLRIGMSVEPTIVIEKKQSGDGKK